MSATPNSAQPAESGPAARSDPPGATGPAWTVFAGVDGAAIRATCALDQVIALKTFERAGWRLRPAVADVSGPAPAPLRISALDWRDAERVDVAVLDRAGEVLAGHGPAPLLVTPASFSTVSSQRGRRLVTERVEALATQFGRRVAVELRDLRGVPSSRLAEVIGLIRSSCHGVLGEVEPDRADIAAVAGCGLNGLSVRPRRDWTAEPRLVEQFTGLGDLARRIAPFAMTRAFEPANLALLAKAGFSHATIGEDQAPPARAAA